MLGPCSCNSSHPCASGSVLLSQKKFWIDLVCFTDADWAMHRGVHQNVPYSLQRVNHSSCLYLTGLNFLCSGPVTIIRCPGSCIVDLAFCSRAEELFPTVSLPPFLVDPCMLTLPCQNPGSKEIHTIILLVSLHLRVS